MSYLSRDEIKTHLYGEVTNEINRGSDDILDSAIAAAIEEVRGYLTAYDTDRIFLHPLPDDIRNPVVLLYAKDIAVWHYIQLSNPGVEMELRQYRYEKAIEYLKAVQSGKTNPNLPLPPPPVGDNNFIKWGSNIQRNNIF